MKLSVCRSEFLAENGCHQGEQQSEDSCLIVVLITVKILWLTYLCHAATFTVRTVDYPVFSCRINVTNTVCGILSFFCQKLFYIFYINKMEHVVILMRKPVKMIFKGNFSYRKLIQGPVLGVKHHKNNTISVTFWHNAMT